jgi:hypothetical protein
MVCGWVGDGHQIRGPTRKVWDREDGLSCRERGGKHTGATSQIATTPYATRKTSPHACLWNRQHTHSYSSHMPRHTSPVGGAWRSATDNHPTTRHAPLTLNHHVFYPHRVSTPPFRLIPPLPLSQPDVPRASRSINSRAHGVSQAEKDGEERESCGDKCQQEIGEAHMVFVRGHVGARMYACRRGRVCYAHTRGWCRVKQPTNNTSAQTMIM